ncbi:MAG TPA: hypothetical protein VMW17_16520 [Candidatus Binatia bacterium]|nr:hypothetical protein [Candidatus Binatia bacterium]
MRLSATPWTPVVAILLVVLLDVTFDAYFWRIPKLSDVFTDYGYELLSTVHRLKAGKPEGAIRVVAFGSSVAFSFDATQVTNLVETATPNAHLDVSRLLLPGAKPSDYRLLWGGDGTAMRADVAVAIVNLGDFLNPSFEGQLKEQVRYVLPPWQTLIERHSFVGGLSGQLDLALASVSHLYRYRKLIRSCIQDHVKFGLQWFTKRDPLQGYGFYADGYARQEFGMPLASVNNGELEYYIDPEWLRQQGRVAIEFSIDGKLFLRRAETTSGWKRVRLDAPSTARMLQVATDSEWTPRAAAPDGDIRLLGVRLRQPPPARWVNSSAPFPTYSGQWRRRRQDDGFLREEGLSGQAFVDRWQQVLAGNTQFAQQMRGYQREKLSIRERAFEPRGEYDEIERLVASLSRQGISVALVNSPESPLILPAYRDTPYYQAHLAFLRGLADKYRGVRFYDFSAELPAEDFNDWHHPNYFGIVKLGSPYADTIRQAIADRYASHDP